MPLLAQICYIVSLTYDTYWVGPETGTQWNNSRHKQRQKNTLRPSS